MTVYDPPSGWLYGFPRAYTPLPGESLKDTLIRDGYPAKDAEWAAKHCRWWTRDEPDIGSSLEEMKKLVDL